MKRIVVSVCAGLFSVALVACSSSSSSSSAGTGGSSGSGGIGATEKDFAISLASSSAAAGDVSFDITNEGPSAHEFVVIASDLAPDALPVEDAEVQEDTVEVVGEQEDIAPSTTATLTLELDAGSYVVICNLPGHYEKGMYAGLTVT
jgi:plastocyanin